MNYLSLISILRIYFTYLAVLFLGAHMLITVAYF